MVRDRERPGGSPPPGISPFATPDCGSPAARGPPLRRVPSSRRQSRGRGTPWSTMAYGQRGIGCAAGPERRSRSRCNGWRRDTRAAGCPTGRWRPGAQRARTSIAPGW